MRLLQASSFSALFVICAGSCPICKRFLIFFNSMFRLAPRSPPYSSRQKKKSGLLKRGYLNLFQDYCKSIHASKLKTNKNSTFFKYFFFQKTIKHALFFFEPSINLVGARSLHCSIPNPFKSFLNPHSKIFCAVRCLLC